MHKNKSHWDHEEQIARSQEIQNFTPVTISTVKRKRELGISLNVRDWTSIYATTAVLLFSLIAWLIYTMEPWGVKVFNVAIMAIINVVVLVRLWLKVEDIPKSAKESEKNLAFIQYIAIFITVVLLTDLLFDVYWVSNLFGADNILSRLVINMAIILSVLIAYSLSYLIVSYNSDKKTESYAITLSVMIIIVSLVILIWLIASLIILQDEMAAAGEVIPSNEQSWAKSLQEAFFHMDPERREYHEAQYGGASTFTMTWEMLFYNTTSGIMLTFMVVGTFANIFVINSNKTSSLKNATTMTVVGLPMVMIVMIFLGVLPPPASFVKVFGSEAIASFMYAFAMVSVFIIFLSLMMVFSHAAEAFNIEDD